jgi:leucine dehydrogenase
MTVLDALAAGGHERAVFCHDSQTGLRAVIAIHSTRRGPALGGCRMYPYRTEADALNDALRLSRAMSLKAAISDLPVGGGKSVIIGDPARDKNPALLQAFGRAVDDLHGSYLVTEDVGISAADLTHVRSATTHVALAGNPRNPRQDGNYMTALGAAHGIRAALRHAFGSGELAGRTIAIQGIGQVGSHLARILHEHGARLIIADTNPHAAAALEDVPARVVTPGEIHTVACDVFAPCALGGVINRTTTSQLQCRIVAGAANNILAGPGDGLALHHAGILYAPDFVINAGGMIWEAAQLVGWDYAETRKRIEAIEVTAGRVFHAAEAASTDPAQAAEQAATQALNGTR